MAFVRARLLFSETKLSGFSWYSLTRSSTLARDVKNLREKHVKFLRENTQKNSVPNTDV